MATISNKAFECMGQHDGSAPLMGNTPLLSGQVPNFGDLVFKDSNGVINECGADPANIAGVMAHEYNETYAGTFDGAADLLQSTASTDMQYYKADPNNRFIGNLAGKTLARTDEGTAYGVVLTSGVWVIDGADTTNTRVTVLKILNDDTNGVVGDTGARVIFRFNAANFQE